MEHKGSCSAAQSRTQNNRRVFKIPWKKLAQNVLKERLNISSAPKTRACPHSQFYGRLIKQGNWGLFHKGRIKKSRISEKVRIDITSVCATCLFTFHKSQASMSRCSYIKPGVSNSETCTFTAFF